ncbi:serine protease [Pseudoalteromonas luteoviolacea]|uniref:Acrosin n=1 Tax=Pseudoalteromonas luteoviolacea S4054 TaxID=1129367 RepID=A0A0F6A537_9GAMM|nr:serine protease [Pseudoalteromonas luteoviolacea]AOT07567.1 hypothetical protein S4054249_06810 [Pseudoalteromonas luteoviolacea]AOT12483.1 hypothetical protein S40542_06810 [Pseudoalteromonas luteoviolacea]AOT17397.1 hypothetical protein S4054_06810 [Pseudoalteromonas luteoviolacea]KKE81302.1 hypothetical protein N479_22465 [Pseudoalteromonas luteoviolacea S4054]KZN70689.1 hypothetical protein N481_20970 [Pseudoalteromonas luteoviolacea S4047-1]
MLSSIQSAFLLAMATSPLMSNASNHHVVITHPQQINGPITTNEIEPRIVGGNEAAPYSYPFMGSLYLKKSDTNSEFWCGISFIGDNKVLTASHCVANHSADQFIVKFGGHDVTDSAQWQTYQVENMVMHEHYKLRMDYDNDIAVLTLGRPVTNIQPIKLATQDVKNTLVAGDMLRIIGWGKLSEKGALATKLQEVDVPFITNTVCNGATHYNGLVSDTMICAGFDEGGKDACQGDSGGPLIVKQNDEWIQLGIASWGNGCAQPNRPGVYTDVASLFYWTYANTNEFGFSAQLRDLYLPDEPAASISGSFTNTLDTTLSIAEFTLVSEPNKSTHDVEIISQNCANSTLISMQSCQFEVRTQDAVPYGQYTFDVSIEEPGKTTYSSELSYHKVTDISASVNAHLSTPDNIKWSTGGDEKWYTDTTDSSTKALLSGQITDKQTTPSLQKQSQKTYLLLEVNDAHISTVSFDYLLSSEKDHDMLKINHNGAEIHSDSGQNKELVNVSIDLEKGPNQILIEYSKDHNGSVGNDNVAIQNISFTSTNQYPSANIKQASIDVRSGFDYVLDASQSSDSDGDSITFQWIDLNDPKKVIGTESTLPLTAQSTSQDISKTYQVLVTDQYNATSTAQVNVHIAANRAPEIHFNNRDFIARSGAEFIIDASATTDPEQDLLHFTWHSLNAPNNVISNTDTLTISPSQDVEHSTIRYQLTVTDHLGASSTQIIEVQVVKNTAPELSLVSHTQMVSSGETVLITSQAADPDGDNITYIWAQTSGTKISFPDHTEQLSFVAPEVTQAERLTFSLTVTDAYGSSQSKNIGITVNAKKDSGSFSYITLLLMLMTTGMRRRFDRK